MALSEAEPLIGWRDFPAELLEDKMRDRLMGLLIAGAVSLTAAPALAQTQEVQGIVVTNQNHRLTLKTPQGDQTIAIAPNVRVRSISGAFNGNKETVPLTAVIPGLPVVVQVESSAGGLVASEIDYKAKDYKTAAQIQAGVQETARREAELRSAYSKMGDWDVRAEKVIYFKVGSAAISSDARRDLLTLANTAKSHKGYVVSVLGYADPTGNAAANERLSNRRAQAVINFLKQSGHLLPGRVLSASAMGEMKIPIDKPDSASYANARRVMVRVLTSAAHLNAH
jgi:outer membrane protein OmpA-like peptidoglycan-associated protein